MNCIVCQSSMALKGEVRIGGREKLFFFLKWEGLCGVNFIYREGEIAYMQFINGKKGNPAYFHYRKSSATYFI